jgi:hypothetical protein
MKMHMWILRPRCLILASLLMFQCGCAIHYYDAKTETEHLWGLGHMKMKVTEPNEGLEAVVHGTDVLGVSLGMARQHSYLTVGWHRVEFIDIRKESTAFRIERPWMSFSNVRVGSEFPLLKDLPDGALPENVEDRQKEIDE